MNQQQDTIQKWYGVNLGGWLILEKWITPSVFAGHIAKDEYSLCLRLGAGAQAALKPHRDTFITERDFKWIAGQGMNAVRSPVGYWVFGNEPPYAGCIEYVDMAFDWAEKYGLKILLDFHALPGSQNGQDHSGHVGKIGWPQKENVEKSLAILGRLAERYAGREGLAAIGVINEPAWSIGKRRLVEYYERSYDVVRRYCGPALPVIISDAYKPKRWRWVMRDKRFTNMYLDVHLYQTHGTRDRRRSFKKHLKLASIKRLKLLSKVQKRWPIVVGEWSVALPSGLYKGLTTNEKHALLLAYAGAQVYAQSQVAGWFYWTYITEHGGEWSYRHMVHDGVFSKLPPNSP